MICAERFSVLSSRLFLQIVYSVNNLYFERTDGENKGTRETRIAEQWHIEMRCNTKASHATPVRAVVNFRV
jgi:predicted GNAT superfamily acetyltransferase